MKRFFAPFVIFVLSISSVLAVALTQTPANVVPSASVVYLQGDHYAIGTIAAGQPVYYSTAVSNPSPTTPDIGLANAAGTGDSVKVIGVAAGGASAGQPIKVITRDPALKLGVTNVAGDVIYLGITAGALTSTYADLVAGNYVCVLAVGTASGTVNFGA